MPKLPDAFSLGDRPVPQSNRPIVGYRAGQEGEAMQEAGRDLGKFAAAERDKQDRLESAFAESALLRGQLDAMDELEKDTDYTTYQSRFEKKMAEVRQQAAGMIRDGGQRSLFDAQADTTIARGLAQVKERARAKEKDFGQASLFETLKQNADAALRATDEPTRARLLLATNDAIHGAADRGYISEEEAAKTRSNFLENYALTRVQMLPPEEQVKALATAPGSGPRDVGADTVKPFTPDKINQVRSLVDAPSPYDPIFQEAAQQHGLDWKELKLRAAVESGLNPKAVGPETKYGQSVGMMQLTEDTAKNLGVKDRTDPREAIFGGAKLLADHMREAGGDLPTVDRLYYGGADRGKWGKNTEQYAENFQALRAPGGKTGTYLDFIPPDKRVELLRRNQLALHADLDKRVEDSVAMAAMGKPNPTPVSREEFSLAYEGKQAEEKYQSYLASQKLGEATWQVGGMTPAEQATALEAAKPQPGDRFAEGQKNYDLLKTAIDSVNKQRAQDPMAFAQARALIPAQSLDFNNPAAMTGQLKDRAAQALAMRQSFGSPAQALTADEAKRFSSALEQMPTADKLGYLKTFRDGLADPQVYQATLQQIRPDSPVTAMAGMYLGLDKELTTATHWFSGPDTIRPEAVAARIFEGEDLLNPTKAAAKEDGKGKAFPMPPDGTPNSPGLRDTFNTYVGDSFRGQPKLADQAYQAFKAFYAGEAARQGKYTGEQDDAIAASAAKSVVGTIVEKNGKHVVAPWGMDETTFNDLAALRFAESAQSAGIKTRWDDVGLENTGDPDAYRLTAGAGYLLDKAGKPLVIHVTPRKTPGPGVSSLGVPMPE